MGEDIDVALKHNLHALVSGRMGEHQFSSPVSLGSCTIGTDMGSGTCFPSRLTIETTNNLIMSAPPAMFLSTACTASSGVAGWGNSFTKSGGTVSAT
jgi:hypothetical protein